MTRLRLLAFAIAALIAAPRPAAAYDPLPMDTYTQPPTIDLIELSPSGERMAFVADDHGVRKVFIRVVGGAVLVAAPPKAGDIRALMWADEDTVLVWLGERSRITLSLDENYGFTTVFAMDVRRGTLTALERTISGLGFYGLGQSQGHRYGYFGETSAYWPRVLHRIDLQTGAAIRFDSPIQPVVDWSVSTDGSLLARAFYKEVTGHWSIAAAATDKTLAEGDDPYDGVSIAGEGRTRGTLAFWRPGSDGYGALFELSLGSAAPATALSQGQNVDQVRVDLESHLLLGYEYEDEVPHDVMFDPERQRRVDAAHKAFPGFVSRIVSGSRDFGRMIVLTSGKDDSGTYWLVDTATGHATVLGAMHPRITAAHTGLVQLIHYKAADGLPLTAVLTLPPGIPPHGLPLVVIAHGGPEGHAIVGFDWQAQLLASRGYAVLEPNFRGSGGLGRRLRDAGFNEWGRKMQTDLSDAVADLAAKGVVDPGRACIMGNNYGGYAALAGVTVQRGIYRCAVAIGGIGDLRDLLNEWARDGLRGHGWGSRHWRHFMGDDVSGVNVDDFSPLRLADRADAPVLLIHGWYDGDFMLDQSREMQGALKKAGKPVELMTLNGGDSPMPRTTQRNAVFTTVLAFLMKNNPPN